MIDIDQFDRKPEGFAVAHDDLQNGFAQNYDREKRAAQIKEAEDLVRIHHELDTLKRQRDMLLEALKKISSPTQTENLTWWQNEARAAIAAVESEK